MDRPAYPFRIRSARPLLKVEAELVVGQLAVPEQIIQINQRIDNLFKRDYLTASEVADLAEAKSALFKAVDIYLAIVHDVGRMKSED